MAGGADPGFGNIPRDLEHEKFILEFACTPPGFQTAEGGGAGAGGVNARAQGLFWMGPGSLWRSAFSADVAFSPE